MLDKRIDEILKQLESATDLDIDVCYQTDGAPIVTAQAVNERFPRPHVSGRAELITYITIRQKI